MIPYLSQDQKKDMYVLLDKVCNILTDGSVRYWLSYLTLLGAVQYRDFVPWVDRLEIQMLVEDVDFLNNINFKKHDLVIRNTKFGYEVHDSVYQFPKVEIYLMRREPNMNGGYIIPNSVPHSYRSFQNPHNGGERYASDFLFPLRKLTIGNYNFFTPQQPHEWLWRVFGLNYLQTGLVVPPLTNPNKFTPFRVRLDSRTLLPFTKRPHFTSKEGKPQQSYIYY